MEKRFLISWLTSWSNQALILVRVLGAGSYRVTQKSRRNRELVDNAKIEWRGCLETIQLDLSQPY
jgi:hypothetical protein